jgi:hypothetical protein
MGHVARVGERRGLYRVLEGKPERKIQLGRPRHRWKDNIKLFLLEMGWRGMGWIALAQDRVRWRAVVNKVMSLRFP